MPGSEVGGELGVQALAEGGAVLGNPELGGGAGAQPKAVRATGGRSEVSPQAMPAVTRVVLDLIDGNHGPFRRFPVESLRLAKVFHGVMIDAVPGVVNEMAGLQVEREGIGSEPGFVRIAQQIGVGIGQPAKFAGLGGILRIESMNAFPCIGQIVMIEVGSFADVGRDEFGRDEGELPGLSGPGLVWSPLDGNVVCAPSLLVQNLDVASDTGFEVDR